MNALGVNRPWRTGERKAEKAQNFYGSQISPIVTLLGRRCLGWQNWGTCTHLLPGTVLGATHI